MTEQVVLLVVLAMAAYRDYKERQICLKTIILAGIVGLFLQFFFCERTVMDLILGAGIGVLILIIAWIGDECIGMGDGMLLVVTGIYLGAWKNLELFLVALLFVGIAGLFLIVIRKKRRDYRVPFVPFLLVAYLFQIVWEINLRGV